MATGRQTLQLMEEAEKSSLHLNLEAEEALRAVAVSQGQMAAESSEDRR
jgi:hypothetical protein